MDSTDNTGVWSNQVIARVLSSYATSFLDLAQLLRTGGRWPKEADELVGIAAHVEVIAGIIRRGGM